MIENSYFLLLTLDIKMDPSITKEKIISQSDVGHGVWAIHGRESPESILKLMERNKKYNVQPMLYYVAQEIHGNTV